MKNSESKIFTTENVAVPASGTASAQIRTDSSFSFLVQNIVAFATDADNVKVTIRYNTDTYLLQNTRLSLVANSEGSSSPRKQIEPFTVLENGSIYIDFEDISGSINNVEIAFIGRRINK